MIFPSRKHSHLLIETIVALILLERKDVFHFYVKKKKWKIFLCKNLSRPLLVKLCHLLISHYYYCTKKTKTTRSKTRFFLCLRKNEKQWSKTTPKNINNKLSTLWRFLLKKEHFQQLQVVFAASSLFSKTLAGSERERERES